jgi:hypothetical protein
MYREVYILITSNMTDDVKASYNAYHREYYKNKVDKTKRAEQFSAYYIKNKERLSAERKIKRDLKKQALKTTTDVVAVALHV